MTRYCILITAQHYEDSFARIHLEDQCLYRLTFCEAKDLRDICSAFFGLCRKSS